MCGIVGLLSLDGDLGAHPAARQAFERLLRVAESRGREASGVIWLSSTNVTALKAPEPATRLMRQSAYANAWSRWTGRDKTPLQAVMGHSRLTTHGSELFNDNNQPVQAAGYTLVHNGIVTNWRALWDSLGRQPRTELDSEVLPALLDHPVVDGGLRVEAALAQLRSRVQGTVSIAVVHRDSGTAWLYSNHGSLYWARVGHERTVAFASESRFLHKAFGVDGITVHQVEAGQMVLVDMIQGSVEQREPRADAMPRACVPRRTEDWVESDTVTPPHGQAAIPRAPDIHLTQGWKALEIDWERIRNLRRCAKGVLPETMPFIAFDADGVSNYARHHVAYKPRGEAALSQQIQDHLQHHGKRCLVAFSGGRDSSFGLQYLKQAGLEPMAYSYDWGMLTDLARRNQARLCGALGVEHIIVSADVRSKRENIRSNVLAWLKRPQLGTVPLFMAGDKQYFYYANALKRAYGLNWVVLAANPLERTYFKSGFAGIEPGFGDRPKALDRLRLLGFYGKAFLRNPAYLNSSLLDTAGAFISYYAIKHDHLRIFDYLRWNEEAIDRQLQSSFDWEHATDTKTTWRIGDGTAAFYNYIFLQVAGFTENDSLRHNQTLEGDLTRSQALALVERDNQPRFESIEWYCRTVGIDPIATLRQICAIPKLYASR
jgi:glutamine---fructose-6-phosphate transaminase (isomerizing)